MRRWCHTVTRAHAAHVSTCVSNTCSGVTRDTRVTGSASDVPCCFNPGRCVSVGVTCRPPALEPTPPGCPLSPPVPHQGCCPTVLPIQTPVPTHHPSTFAHTHTDWKHSSQTLTHIQLVYTQNMHVHAGANTPVCLHTHAHTGCPGTQFTDAHLHAASVHTQNTHVYAGVMRTSVRHTHVDAHVCTHCLKVQLTDVTCIQCTCTEHECAHTCTHMRTGRAVPEPWGGPSPGSCPPAHRPHAGASCRPRRGQRSVRGGSCWAGRPHR